jgi:hypothetical protein
MKGSRRRVVVALAALAAAPAFAQDVQVLVLRYRSAEEVIPMLLPYLDPAGKLTGQGSELHVRTTRQNLAQIRQLLVTLDRAPRWLILAVRQDPPTVLSSETRKPHGSTTTDSRSASAARNDGGAWSTRAQSSEQTIRVLEGTRAVIQFETAVPMTFRRFVFGHQRVDELGGIVTYDAVVQFLVRPRLVGDVVTLEIEPQEDPVLMESGERWRLSTTARGRLGDWIAVGGAELRSDNNVIEARDGTLQAQTRPATNQRGVWLKVDFEESGVR